MEKTEAKRQLILNQIADHLLAAGLKDASLRHLAAAIGTSDRMLLHYFVDKDELMAAALNVVAARLIGLLESTRSHQMPFQALMPHLAGMIEDPGPPTAPMPRPEPLGGGTPTRKCRTAAPLAPLSLTRIHGHVPMTARPHHRVWLEF